jgi:hypothetical protein
LKSKVAAFMHVEIVHSDPYGAAKFLEEIFDAEQVEKKFSSSLEARFPGLKVIHMKMGNVIFQIVKPIEGLVSWTNQLKTAGPGIHNISMAINDLESVREALLSKGCTEQAKLLVERKDGQGSGQLPAYIIDAFEQAGMRLELVPSEAGYKSDSGYELVL